MAYQRPQKNATAANVIPSTWASGNRALVITEKCEYYTDSSVIQRETEYLETLLQQYTGGEIYITTIEMGNEGTEFELNTISTQKSHLLNNVIASLDTKKWAIQERRPTVPSFPTDDTDDNDYAPPNVKIFILKHHMTPFMTIGLLTRIMIGLIILFLGGSLLYLSYSALETTTL